MTWNSNVFNSVVIVGSGGRLLVYSPTVGAGDLVDSISASKTTDSFGNTVQAGITNYSPASNLFAQLNLGALTMHSSGMTAQNGSIGAEIASDAVVIDSGQATGHNPTQMTLGSTTGITTVDGRDLTSYGVERQITPIPSGNIPAGGTVYTLLNIALIPAVMTYKFRVFYLYENTVIAGTANFQLGGTASLGTRQTLFTRNNDVGAGTVTPGSPATFTNIFSGGTANTGRQFMEIEGIVDLTSSGTLTLTVTRNIAGDNVLVGNCWYEIYPI